MAKAPKDAIEDAEVVSENGGASSVEARPDRDVTVPAEGAPASEVEAMPDADARTDAAAGGSGGGMPPAVVPTPEPRRGDSVPFLMALLGGVIAAGIGWAVATYAGGDDARIEAALAERDAEIAELRGALERVGAIETRLSELPEPAADRGPEIDTLAERLAAIEERPNPEGPDLTPIEQALVAAAEADEALAARLDDVAAAQPEIQAALTERIDALETRVDGVSLGGAEVAGGGGEREVVTALREDLRALSARVDALASDISEAGDAAALEAEVAALEERIAAEAEAREAALSETREEIGAAVSPLRADLDALAADLTAREEAIAAERARLEEEARRAAADEARRAAAASVVAAIDTGAPFEEPLSVLQEQQAEVPSVLADAAPQGVPTLASLQERFPDLARETVFAAPSGEEAGAGDFLRRQLGVRSVAARDGDDPDAVLSRAEDALRRGDLEAAVAEAESLDPEIRTPLGAWLEDARLRLDARGAALSLQDG